jgi:glycosyltransferase involved in cell wall biosynthesis
VNLCAAVEQSGRFDVVHSHAYLWGLPLSPLSRAPMVHTMHVTPYDDAAKLRMLYPDEAVTAISAFQWSAFPTLPQAPVIHHGVDERAFLARPVADDYVCFLGRFTPGKGPLDAIETARRLGIPLKLAGPETDYFRERIAPLVDGEAVQYVGYVDPVQRAELLSGARALIYPVKSPEPFGLVLVEAMLSGTPVAAYDLGAVGEIVVPVAGGVLTPADGDLAGAVTAAMQLDRCVIAERARTRFSAARMAADYAALYETVVAKASAR